MNKYKLSLSKNCLPPIDQANIGFKNLNFSDEDIKFTYDNLKKKKLYIDNYDRLCSLIENYDQGTRNESKFNKDKTYIPEEIREDKNWDYSTLLEKYKNSHKLKANQKPNQY